MADILSKSKGEYIEKERLRRKEKAELKFALNESLKSQNLSMRSRDDFIFGDSALKRPTVAMPSKSNRSATVTSVSTFWKSELLKSTDLKVYYSNEYYFSKTLLENLVFKKKLWIEILNNYVVTAHPSSVDRISERFF